MSKSLSGNTKSTIIAQKQTVKVHHRHPIIGLNYAEEVEALVWNPRLLHYHMLKKFIKSRCAK